jgi:hypothetical protein
MSWETAPIKRRRPPWHRFVLAWLIISVLMIIEPFLAPYRLWRMAEDIRNARQMPVPPRRSPVHHQRPSAR